jgi:hypothetical protein
LSKACHRDRVVERGRTVPKQLGKEMMKNVCGRKKRGEKNISQEI